MANIKTEFGTSTALTITLASLAASTTAGRESTAVDNTSNKFVDALVTVICQMATGTPASEQAIYVYAYGSEDGTNYNDNATGSDAALTFRNPSNMPLIGRIEVPAAVTGGATFKGVFSVAAAFGGVLPRKWGIVVKNSTNLSLAASGNSASYTGIYYTSV